MIYVNCNSPWARTELSHINISHILLITEAKILHSKYMYTTHHYSLKISTELLSQQSEYSCSFCVNDEWLHFHCSVHFGSLAAWLHRYSYLSSGKKANNHNNVGLYYALFIRKKVRRLSFSIPLLVLLLLLFMKWMLWKRGEEKNTQRNWSTSVNSF